MATPTHDFPLAGETATQDTGPDIDGSIAGASGSDASGVSLSREGLIAIIVVVCVVGIFGIGSAVLFYVAKKREWTVRETIRRSARKVVTALTPRRSEFPKSVKESRSGRVRLDDVPPTPRIRPEHLNLDLEKGAVGGDKAGKKKRTPNFSRK